MGQESSKSDREARESHRQSRQETWQQNCRRHPNQTQTTEERQRNPYSYTGDNLQNTLRPASVYPDLRTMNTATIQRVAPPTASTATTQRVAPPTSNAAATQRVAPPTANAAATQRVAPPTANAAATQRVAPPTANAAATQRVASPTANAAATQRAAPPTANAAATQRVAPPTANAAATQRVAPPTANAAATQRAAPPTANAAATQRVAPPTANAAATQRVAPPTANTATTQRVDFPTANVAATQRAVPPTANIAATQRVDFPAANTAATQRVASPTVMPAQKDASPAAREGHSNCFSANGSCVRKETEDFVFVNNYVQTQLQTAKPSAPPANHVPCTMYFESSKLTPGPPAPRTLGSPVTAGASAAPAHPTQKNQRSRSASRVRSPDDRFNCPTCGLLLGLTIFFCQRGHSACQECQQANRLCGQKIRREELCRTPIGNIRNISVEAMVADHLICQRSVCPNVGCSLSYNMADMAQHQRVCPFGETDCPMGTLFGQCQQRYKVDTMASHFDAFHREQRVADFGKEMFIFNCMESQKMFLIKNGPYNFLVHVKVAEQARNIYMTVQLFGTAVSASKWKYEFHVYNKSQPRRKFMFVDSCHTTATPVHDIFKEAKCATMPLNYAMTYVNEGVLTYKFYVKKTETHKVTRSKNWKRQNQQV